MLSEKRQYIFDVIEKLLIPPKLQEIPEWAVENVRLPADTPNPGYFSLDTAPYQEEILRACSPQNPTRDIVLVFGSQMGKTLIEEIVMLYHIAAYPRPQAFAFSNDQELDRFVKTKFNTILESNPPIKELLGQGMNRGGNSLSEKQYPGGFLLFVAANVAAKLRSYSVEVGIFDEVDATPLDVNGEGSPISQFEKRTNTFSNSRKVVLSSTPHNIDSQILDRLENTSLEVYNVPCPHCHELITLEWENMHWETTPDKKTVTKAWYTCPKCHKNIRNADKTYMLDPANGARWIATNPSAPSYRRGFLITTLYARVGWIDWLTLCQQYVDALNAKPELRKNQITAFYNTVLCRQYRESNVDIPTAENIGKFSDKSSYRRGKIPSWVGVITTGSDVQKNRIETTIMGWGRRGRNIVIDHLILNLDPNEQMQDINNSALSLYVSEILEAKYEREDGCTIQCIGNALDHSYLPDTIDNFYIKQKNLTLYPIHGLDKELLKNALSPAQIESKRQRGARYYDTPVSGLKKVVFSDIQRTLEHKPGEDMPYGYSEFPCDLPFEFYEQLASEKYEYQTKTKKFGWVKQRERNEALDCRVYNYAVIYYSKVNAFSDEDWDTIFHNQELAKKRKTEIKNGPRKKGPKIISKGIV